MEKIIKQSVGIDIAKDTFVACVAKKTEDDNIILSESIEFENKKKGFNQLVKWISKKTEKSVAIVYVLEATGSYGESLANHLYMIKKDVVVELPNKITHYSKSLNVKTKTDSVDAKVIAQYGLSRKLELWNPPAQFFKDLRSLTRLKSSLQKQKTINSNQQHALNHSYEPNKQVLKSLEKLVKAIDDQISKIGEEIVKLINENDEYKEKINNLATIKGLGILTIAVIIGETQGFAMIRNRKQLASYAGLDVIARESGTSVKGKTKISKKGNSHIRAALYTPAMCAANWNTQLKEDYERINKGKPSIRIARIAVMRKLLLLTFTLWKNDDIYRTDMSEYKSLRDKKEE